jgi:hypothetical protein
MSRLAYTVTPTSVNLLLDGRMRTINSTHVNFNAIRDWLKKYGANPSGASATYINYLRDLVDIPSFVAKVTEGRVQVGGDKVLFDGKEVAGVICQRIVDMLTQGFDVRPIARFLDKLMTNPTLTARDEMYLFLESGNLPITEDGDFLAFKKVDQNYKSFYDGKTDNSIGSRPSMPRDEVCADRHDTCSRGLHFCSFDYLSGYQGDTGHVVICKINPADVVAIPSDYNNTKGRAWTYEIIGEVPHEECKHVWDNRAVVNAFGTYQQSAPERAPVDDYDADGDHAGYDEYEGYDDMSFGEMPNGDNTDYNAPASSESNEGPETLPVLDIETAGGPVITKVPMKRGDKAFEHGGRTFLKSELKKLVKEHGQRGTQRLTGIPRSTLQGWLA